jgi:aspartate aminotransferase
MDDDGKFQMPAMDEIREAIRKHKPSAMVVIPYDNPTGHFVDRETFVELAKLCVEANLWMVSDEAYRELYYVDKPVSSVWAITEAEVSGIAGRRISIESASKVWNACGLRIGALVTDNAEFHAKSVAESTANLCANAIGQYVFGALAHEAPGSMREWFGVQRDYYKAILDRLVADFAQRMPGVVVSSPDASIYAVVDVRRIAKPGLDATEFVLFCTSKGVVEVKGERLTLLVAPMAGFYSVGAVEPNPGKTQMRIALVEPSDRMALVPTLFAELFRQFEAQR